MGPFLLTLFLIVCILLIVVVLLQKGRGGGLGAAFGGGGGSAFGTKTGDVFTWVTIVLTGLFLLLAIIATVVYRPPPGDVKPPEFTPPDGSVVVDTLHVTLRTETPNAAIYYTTDNSEPTQQSKQYVKYFEVTAGTTVKAKAFVGDRSSETAVARYISPEAAVSGPEVEPETRPAATIQATRPAEPAKTQPVEPATTQPAPAATQPGEAKK